MQCNASWINSSFYPLERFHAFPIYEDCSIFKQQHQQMKRKKIHENTKRKPNIAIINIYNALRDSCWCWSWMREKKCLMFKRMENICVGFNVMENDRKKKLTQYFAQLKTMQKNYIETWARTENFTIFINTLAIVRRQKQKIKERKK